MVRQPGSQVVSEHEAKPRKLEHYLGPNSEDYFGDWIRGLGDRKARAIIFTRLGRIKKDGNFGTHRSVGAGVWELIIDYGPGYRVYYGLDGDRLVILLAGGSKKRQDTDIKLAKARWDEYNA